MSGYLPAALCPRTPLSAQFDDRSREPPAPLILPRVAKVISVVRYGIVAADRLRRLSGTSELDRLTRTSSADFRRLDRLQTGLYFVLGSCRSSAALSVLLMYCHMKIFISYEQIK